MGICTTCGVEGKVNTVGLCHKDYMAEYRKKMKDIPCKVEGCTKGSVARMMCDRHYYQYKRAEKNKAKNQTIIRAAVREERDRIVVLLRKYGHNHAADIVSVSFSTVGL